MVQPAQPDLELVQQVPLAERAQLEELVLPVQLALLEPMGVME